MVLPALPSTPLTESLRGVVVLDFGQLIAGPVCAMWLADLGATVIKVEPPDGELGRRLGPPWHHGTSLATLTSNRNKRGLCLDLKRPEAVAVIHRLVGQVDVVVENFRPGVTARLGIDHAPAPSRPSDRTARGATDRASTASSRRPPD